MKMIMPLLLLGLLLSSCAHEKSPYTPEQDALAEKIKSALDANIPKFRSCYLSELEKSKNGKKLKGKVEARFKVGEDGSVLSSSVTSEEIKDGITLRCMKIILDEIKFPKPIEGKSYEVSQPINMNSF